MRAETGSSRPSVWDDRPRIDKAGQKGKRQETEELTEGKVQTRGAEHVPLSCGRQYISLRIWENGDLVM